MPNSKKVLLTRIACGAVLLLGICVFGVLLYLSIAYFGLRPIVRWEYGNGGPDIDVFSPKQVAVYTIPPESNPALGWHRLAISVNGHELPVWMQVRDTTAPQAQSIEKTISIREELRPDELIAALSDADRVKVSFAETPPFGTIGDYPVTVLLEDGSGNQDSVTSLLHIRVIRQDSVTIEAGDPAPEPEDFLLNGVAAQRMSRITDEMLHTPGEHPIELTVGGGTYSVKLIVRDTVAPVVTAETLFCEPERDITPSDFLKVIDDETETEAVFLTKPDMEKRTFQQVTIRVTDAGGNFTDVSAGLLLTHAKPIAIEARNTPLTIAECLKDTVYGDAQFIKSFVPDEIGFFTVSVLVDGEPEIVLVEVEDTVAPKIGSSVFNGYTGIVKPAAEVCKVTDATAVTVSFTEEPDWNQVGDQQTEVVAVDAAGNEASATVILRLKPDTEPPVLYGVKHRYFYLDDPIAYLTGVGVTDNADPAPVITVDTHAVDPSRTGTYTVLYTATDAAGNSVSQEAAITIKKSKASEATLTKYLKRILNEIIMPEMALADKVEAIYQYVYTHVKYIAVSDKTDWRRAALSAIRNGRGGCFAANSLARALLEYTEAEVCEIQRSTGKNSNHYWLLVNVGTGWYHFDATKSREHNYQCCMWTDAQCSVKGRFWAYEKSTVPAVATERFDHDKATAVEAEWVAAHPPKAGQ